MIRGGGAPRIVAADENIAMRELIALVLRGRSFDVVVASNGEAALSAILSDGADGLVSDVEMPGLLTVPRRAVCSEVRGLTQRRRSWCSQAWQR
jgi:CheY-like chemotaxis protein